MKEVVDRIVQYPNRYKLTDVSTGQELGTYDFTEVPGTVQQEGTEINAELFNSITEDLNIDVETIIQIDDGSHSVSEKLLPGGIYLYKL